MKFKYSLFIVLASLFSCSVKRTFHTTDGITVTIRGTTAKLNTPIVHLKSDDYKTNYWVDSIRENKFSGKIMLPHSGFYKLVFEGSYPSDSLAEGFRHDINLYLENSIKYNIEAGTDWNILMDKTKVYSNSSIQSELSSFDEDFYAGFHLLHSTLNNAKYEHALLLQGNADKTRSDAMLKDIALYEKSLNEYRGKFVRGYALKHPASVVAIHFLSIAYDLKENYIQYLEVYNHLEEKIKFQADGILFKKEIDSITKRN